jgi:uridine kinase
MHQQFIEPTKAFADIIPNDKYNTVAIDVVRCYKPTNSIILL